MQKPTTNPSDGWEDGYDPSPTSTGQCRQQKCRERQPRVTGCPMLPQGHSGRRTGAGHEPSPGQEPRGSTLPATPAARAAPPEPLHPPPPQHLLLLLPLLRAGAAGGTRPCPGSRAGLTAAAITVSAAPAGTFRRLGSARPAPPRHGPARPCLLPALPLPPARAARAVTERGFALELGFVPVSVCTASSSASTPVPLSVGTPGPRGAEGLCFALIFVLALACF